MNADMINKYLSHSAEHICVAAYDTIDSTNKEAKRLVESWAANVTPATSATAAKSDMAIVASHQTEGRGRRDHSFYSPEGSGIYLSLLLRPDITPDESVFFMPMAAIAVSEAIEQVSEKHAEIKWVNDIFVGNKKVCGILIESVYSQENAVIVGIGINVYEPKDGFPDEISNTAGAVFEGKNTCKSNEDNEFMCEQLTAKVINRFFDYYSDFLKSTDDLKGKVIIDEYRQRCMAIGKKVVVSDNTAGSSYVAHVIDIDDRCHLIVEKDNGDRMVLSSEEISVSSK